MQTTIRTGSLLRLAIAFAALLGIVAAALIATTTDTQAQSTDLATRDGITGRYLGTQDDVRFGMALEQHGQILRGVIVQPLPVNGETDFLSRDARAIDGDRLFGAVSGSQIFLMRLSQPAQFWWGASDRTDAGVINLAGRWLGPAGEGNWFAHSVRHAPDLAIAARVAPPAIPTGETTRVVYGARIDNAGNACRPQRPVRAARAAAVLPDHVD